MEGSHLGCLSPTPPPARPSPRLVRPGTRRGHHSAKGAALRAGAVPETGGGRGACRSELRLPRRAGESQPAEWPQHPAHGREISRPLGGEAARSRCLSGRRAGDIAPLEVNGLIAADFIRDRDIYVVSQRGTMFSEPALTCAARRLLQRTSRPALLFRGNQARPFGRDGSLPPRARCHRRRPQRLQFD